MKPPAADFRRDVALLLLRTAGLGLALAHGWGKVEALATGHADRFVAAVASLGFPWPLFFAWASALAELVGGLCVALGLGSRMAAAAAAFNMAVAAFRRHHAFAQLLVVLGLQQVSEETLKTWGDPEKALLYFAAFVILLLTGPGRLSLDRVIARNGRG